eukprot:CAMPEP_0175716272 /NCGR_PEP_ID=MMETSP0097-20121207/43063_1 /TAXON_ID=311494 /ORGANISM="Alexandrium monilatum, Strain CCMP3105" /LENGTH=45 /DNA_ID= /DNA_START= /DNA_END= /DNA_ORIENTATION=
MHMRAFPPKAAGNDTARTTNRMTPENVAFIRERGGQGTFQAVCPR